jgi:pimeloyl-ACP methyl ester carboxylesterase
MQIQDRDPGANRALCDRCNVTYWRSCSEAQGTGDPILLIHGFGTNRHSWDYVRPSLLSTHRVISLDLKGFGRSPRPGDGLYSPVDQAGLVVALIEKEGLDDLTVVGHSMGGGIALFVALSMLKTRATRIGRMILLDSMAYRQPLPFFIRTLRIPVLSRLLAATLPARWQVKTVLKEVFHHQDAIPDTLIDHYANSLRQVGGASALVETAQSIIPDNLAELEENYCELKCPTLLIWGEHDRIVPMWIAERLLKALPQARLEVIQNCGHAPQEECPRETEALMKEFLDNT